MFPIRSRFGPILWTVVLLPLAACHREATDPALLVASGHVEATDVRISTKIAGRLQTFGVAGGRPGRGRAGAGADRHGRSRPGDSAGPGGARFRRRRAAAAHRRADPRGDRPVGGPGGAGAGRSRRGAEGPGPHAGAPRPSAPAPPSRATMRRRGAMSPPRASRRAEEALARLKAGSRCRKSKPPAPRAPPPTRASPS